MRVGSGSSPDDGFLYWLAAMVAVLVVGTIIGLIWADTSDVAGLIAVVTNIAGVDGIVFLLIALPS